MARPAVEWGSHGPLFCGRGRVVMVIGESMWVAQFLLLL
jgi:hypothetical protein